MFTLCLCPLTRVISFLPFPHSQEGLRATVNTIKAQFNFYDPFAVKHHDGGLLEGFKYHQISFVLLPEVTCIARRQDFLCGTPNHSDSLSKVIWMLCLLRNKLYHKYWVLTLREAENQPSKCRTQITIAAWSGVSKVQWPGRLIHGGNQFKSKCPPCMTHSPRLIPGSTCIPRKVFD